MLHLPPYNEIKHLEGTGNFAVKAYYRFPQRLFYRHKLKMILSTMDKKLYFNCLDFGCGKARILDNELKKRCCFVFGVDKDDVIDPRWRFNLIVCSSVLEFVNLPHTLSMLNEIMVPKAEILIASPMDTTLTYSYFKLIGDKQTRNTHNDIVKHVSKIFKIQKYDTWLGLYFCLKARKR